MSKKYMKHPPVCPGDRFGRLVVVEREVPDHKNRERFRCRCECGKIKTVGGSSLKSGNSSSCGCLAVERRAAAVSKAMKGKTQPHLYRRGIQPAVGDTFGRLTVDSISAPTAGRRTFTCQCVCGKKVTVRSGTLRGKRPSCGCWHRDWASETFRKDPGEASFRALYRQCARGAKDRGIPFAVSEAEHRGLAVQRCHYCDAPPAFYNQYMKADGTIDRPDLSQATIDNATIYVNGVDRVDNGIGYELSNCVPCCSMCNHAKRDHTVKDFVEWAARVAAFQLRRWDSNAA